MKKTIMSVICAVMAVVICVCFTACSVTISDGSSGGNSNGGSNSGSGTVEITETVQVDTEPGRVSYNVTTAREENYTYADKSGNNYSIPMRIPSVDIDSDGAAKINSEIESTFSPSFDEVEKCVDKGTSTYIFSLDYEYWDSMDILSVCVDLKYQGGHKYGIYNVDLLDGSALDNNSLLTKLGLDPGTFSGDLKTAVENYFRQNMSKSKNDDDSFYEGQLAKTLESDNLANADYYVKSNALYARVDIYNIAGAERSEYLVKVMDL